MVMSSRTPTGWRDLVLTLVSTFTAPKPQPRSLRQKPPFGMTNAELSSRTEREGPALDSGIDPGLAPDLHSHCP